MIHALTVDVEDYHNLIARYWLGREGPPTGAVVTCTVRLCEFFASRGARGTFFFLGEVAAAFPQLVRDVAGAGHEIGVHGFRHRKVFTLSPQEFRQEVGDAKTRLEDVSGKPVRGHRAPAFSIRPETRWAFETLAELGFEYDSSIFPISWRGYGWGDSPRGIHRMSLVNGRTLIEAPLPTVSVLGVRLPSCGGGYLRHFPLAVTRWAMRRVARERPAILYLHPYEIETDVPPLDTSGVEPAAARRAEKFHARQMRNRPTMEGKLKRLLDEFTFAPLAEIIEQVLGGESAAVPT